LWVAGSVSGSWLPESQRWTDGGGGRGDSPRGSEVGRSHKGGWDMYTGKLAAVLA